MINRIISLINNKSSKMQKNSQMNSIAQYRYDKLCEMVMNWDKFDSAADGSTADEVTFYKLLNLFIDDAKRYAVVKPLLDECYIDSLENQKKECENLLDTLLKAETPEGMPTKDFLSILKSYFESGKEFSVLLKGAVNSQMRALLRE